MLIKRLLCHSVIRLWPQRCDIVTVLTASMSHRCAERRGRERLTAPTVRITSRLCHGRHSHHCGTGPGTANPVAAMTPTWYGAAAAAEFTAGLAVGGWVIVELRGPCPVHATT